MEEQRRLGLPIELSSVLRVWRGLPHKNGVLCGTAFMVAPTLAATAIHVVEDFEKKDAEYFLQATWNGGFLVKITSIVPHQTLDVAVLGIDAGCAAPQNLVLHLSNPPALRQGDPIVMIGFADPHTGAEAKFGRVQGIDGVANAPIAGPYPAKGMSGGPVVSEEGRLLGLTWARDVDKGRAYVIPLTPFLQFLVQHGARCVDPAPSCEPFEEDLTAYRITDILEHEARIRELGKLSAKYNRDVTDFEHLVEFANARRMDCDPGDAESKTVALHDLSPPNSVAAASFWKGALRLANVKSPRTYAAFLLTLFSDKPLSAAERQLVLGVLNKLKRK